MLDSVDSGGDRRRVSSLGSCRRSGVLAGSDRVEHSFNQIEQLPKTGMTGNWRRGRLCGVVGGVPDLCDCADSSEY